MAVDCPKGHVSSEADFCSECGAKIAGAEPELMPAVQTGQVCPDCNAPRPADRARFCEICGYNYETGAHGEIPLPASAPITAAPACTVHITIDPALKETGSPDPPSDWQPVNIPAERDLLLIGRTSESRNIIPDIALDVDSAVSHRHAVLVRSNGSGWSIRDIGSSNGTRVNGKDIQPMVDVPLAPGDRITLGHWTCLTLESK